MALSGKISDKILLCAGPLSDANSTMRSERKTTLSKWPASEICFQEYFK